MLHIQSDFIVTENSLLCHLLISNGHTFIPSFNVVIFFISMLLMIAIVIDFAYTFSFSVVIEWNTLNKGTYISLIYCN